MATKKQQKEKNSKRRLLIPFNIGERPHKSKKDYDRQQMKKEVRNEQNS
jgi:hypothetical protein